MPTPLSIKRPKNLSHSKQVLVGIIIAGPIFGLYYFWRRHQEIHFSQPWLNLFAHVVMVAIPLIWAFMISAPRMQFEPTEEEYLGTSSYLDTLPMDWWTLFMMWATPVFAALDMGHSLFAEYIKEPERLSTSPLRALAILALTFVLGLFYATILTGNSEPQTLVSNAGIRPTIIRFFEWNKIHHVYRRGELYSIYHQVNPALPAASFRLRDPKSRATLESYIAAHRIPTSNRTSLQFTFIKAGVLLGFALNLAVAFWLRLNTSLSLLWILLTSFAIGTILTLGMERIRGVHKFGKYFPHVESSLEQRG